MRDNADDLVAVQDGQASDAARLHDKRDFLNRGVLGSGYGIRRHDFTDLEAMFALEVEGDLVRTRQECQQTSALLLSTDLGAMKEVAFGHDADQLVGLIDNRQGAYVVFDIVSIASTIAASTLIVITCRDIIWSARMRMISKRLSGQIPI